MYAYEIEGHGDWTVFQGVSEPHEIADIAEEAAQYEWDYCGGWEWMAKHGCIAFKIYDADTETLIGTATVRLEATMNFYGSANETKE